MSTKLEDFLSVYKLVGYFRKEHLKDEKEKLGRINKLLLLLLLCKFVIV